MAFFPCPIMNSTCITVDTTKIKPFSTYVCSEGVFDSPPFMCIVQLNIFQKTVIKVRSSHIYTSFDTFYVQIGQLIDTQCTFKLSKEFDCGARHFLRIWWFIDFQIFFRKSPCQEWLTNQDAKWTKRVWRCGLQTSIPIFVVHKLWAVKNSFSTYMDGLFWLLK